MREVCIRSRPDGITELSPRLAPLAREERWAISFTVMMSCLGLFTAGLMPAVMLGAVLVSCLAGEVVLGVKATLLLLRPPAEIHEIPVPAMPRRFR